MRISELSALTLLAVATCLGCAHQPREPVLGAPDTGVQSLDAPGRQALFRVRYRGLDGRARVRLTARVSGERFQLAAADTFGRPLWSLDGSDEGGLFLDHRLRELCHFEGDVVIPAIALSEVPVRLLPRVLLFELPFDREGLPKSGDVDAVDSQGRRWTARIGEDGLPEGWTLWQDERALVWWQRTDDGAILSHRDGAQVIWTVVAEEWVAEPISPLTLPEDYGPGHCNDPDVS